MRGVTTVFRKEVREGAGPDPQAGGCSIGHIRIETEYIHA